MFVGLLGQLVCVVLHLLTVNKSHILRIQEEQEMHSHK